MIELDKIGLGGSKEPPCRNESETETTQPLRIEFPCMWVNSFMMNGKNRFFEMVEDTGSMKKLGLLLAKWNGKMEWK